jgi:futalosine hydrolase
MMGPVSAPAPHRTLVLVPTPIERDTLDSLGGFGPGVAVELIGFGAIAAAARTAALLAAHGPARLALVGIAGAYGPRPAAAERFGAVRLDGVGAGAGDGHLLPSALGLPQWSDGEGEVFEELPLADHGGPCLVTVAAAAAGESDVAGRRRRHPGAAGEDMEAFGVALAARLMPAATRPAVHVVRGWSNVAGHRDLARWDIRGALRAARELVLPLLVAPH